MFARRFLAAVAFVAASAHAQLQISNPSPTSWWVAGSTNTLQWNCNDVSYSSYTVVVSNSDSSILAAPLALIASVPNYDCSYTVNAQQSSLAVSNSWTLALANPVNISDIYASTTFSVEAAGSAYPTSSSASPSGSATGTVSGASPSSTSTKTGAASANYIPVGMSMAAALLLGLVVA